MAQIRNFGPLARLRSDASSHVIRYGNKGIRQSGRGLVFWFGPGTSSIAEVPMDDREATLFIKGRSQDFQTVTVQGVLTWRVADPEVLASRVDFSVALNNGQPRSEPIERIEARLAGLVSQAVLEYLAAAPVRALLDAGIEPLRARIEAALAEAPSLSEIAVAVVAVRLTSLTPTSELERALQTPTFEALQQKADEATFERRALAVEKERAIAENELANKVELAKREKLLIVEEAENARNHATGQAEAMQVEAEAEAGRIRTLETAKSEAELARMAIYRDLPPAVMMGLAARELVRIAPERLARLLPASVHDDVALERRTMVEALLENGEHILALNEVFVGHRSHQSARYRIAVGSAEENHSSSGLIVASGTGATGWARSIMEATGIHLSLEPQEKAVAYFVREPFPSVATGTTLRAGKLSDGGLTITSRMNEGGTIFADGMEQDRIAFDWGRRLTVAPSARTLNLVTG